MTAETPLAIRCRHVSKRFADTVAVRDVDLDVWRGSIIGVLGPSGCGKTTLLRLIAGFERPDQGSIEVGSRIVVGPDVFVAAEQRRVGMVFQDYALFPHLSVHRNVAFGLDRNDDRRRRVEEVLDLVGLSAMGDRLPHELSGGEQQRVALARALAPQPEVILLDEPFSNLDAPQRERMRRELQAILVEARTTAVFVTHDQEEALSTSAVVAVMREGRVVQVAPPDELYHHPADRWVARFVGDAEFLPGIARADHAETDLGTFAAPGLEGSVEVMIRPESVQLSMDPGGDAVVIDRQFFGHDQMVTVLLPDSRAMRSRLGPSPVLRPGDRVRVTVEEGVAYRVD